MKMRARTGTMYDTGRRRKLVPFPVAHILNEKIPDDITVTKKK